MAERETRRQRQERRGQERRLRQESIRGRQRWQKTLVAAGAAMVIAISGGYGIYHFIESQQGEGPISQVTTATISAHPLRDQLTEWDNKINTGSIDFLTIAPEIADLASQTLCREIECNPSYEEPPLLLQNNKEFKRTIYIDDPCDTSINPDDDSLDPGYAYSRPLIGDILFNADYLRYTDIPGKAKHQNTATNFFKIYMHEQLHHRAKRVEAQPGELVFVPEESESYPLIMRRGFRSLYRTYKYYSRSEEGCVSGIIHERLLEEAVVDYATQEILKSLGLNLPTPYQNLIQQYRVRVLNPFFSGDYRLPLKFHQNTDQNGFYLALGEGIVKQRGTVLPSDQQVSEAKSYIAGALNLSLP